MNPYKPVLGICDCCGGQMPKPSPTESTCTQVGKGLYITNDFSSPVELADDISFVRCDRGERTTLVLPSLFNRPADWYKEITIASTGGSNIELMNRHEDGELVQVIYIHSDQNKNEIIKDVDRTDHDVRCVEKELCEVKTCMAAGFTKLDGEVKGVYGYIDKQTEIIKELFLKEELRREREKVCELKELVEKKDTDCKFSKVFELIGDVKHRIARDEQRQETAHEYKHLLRDIACIIKKNTPAEETQG